jgi:hypothetical protein
VTQLLAVRACTNPGDGYFLSSDAFNFIAAVWLPESAVVGAVAKRAGVAFSATAGFDANAGYDITGTDIVRYFVVGARNAPVDVGTVEAFWWRPGTVGERFGITA